MASSRYTIENLLDTRIAVKISTDVTRKNQGKVFDTPKDVDPAEFFTERVKDYIRPIIQVTDLTDEKQYDSLMKKVVSHNYCDPNDINIDMLGTAGAGCVAVISAIQGLLPVVREEQIEKSKKYTLIIKQIIMLHIQ
jgi:hypothetical protein